MSDAATLAGAGLLYTMLVMWATQPPYTCALMPDRARQLNLGHSVDREHLDNDARHARADARSLNPTAQPDAFRTEHHPSKFLPTSSPRSVADSSTPRASFRALRFASQRLTRQTLR